MPITDDRRRLFRVWLARYNDWQPSTWNEVPPTAFVLEPAVEECLPHSHAASFVEGFNRTALTGSQCLWAIAVPVTLEYKGDVVGGSYVERDKLARWD